MSESGTASAEARKVPFWQTIYDSFRFVFTDFRRVIAIGWLPLIIIVATNYAASAHWVGYANFHAAITVPVEVLDWLAFPLFAVCWHRFVILNEPHSAAAQLLAWRNFIFLGYAIILEGIPSIIYSLLFDKIIDDEIYKSYTVIYTVIIVSLSLFVLFFMLMRFYLLFPAAALERPLRFGEAWRKMHGNTWRLIGASFFALTSCLIMLLPVFWVQEQLTLQPSAADPPEFIENAVSTALGIMVPVTGFLVMTVEVTILSKFYVHIMGASRRETAATP